MLVCITVFINAKELLRDQFSATQSIVKLFKGSKTNSQFQVNRLNTPLQLHDDVENLNQNSNKQVNMTLTFITDVVDNYHEGNAVIVTDQIDCLKNINPKIQLQVLTLSLQQSFLSENFVIVEKSTIKKLLYILYLIDTEKCEQLISHIRKSGGKMPIFCILDKFCMDGLKILEESTYYEIYVAILANNQYKIFEKCAFCQNGMSKMRLINTWSSIRSFQRILHLNKSFKGTFHDRTLDVAHNYLDSEYDKDKDIFPAEFRMLREVSAMLQFHFSMCRPKDREWGRYTNGKWTGLVGMVHEEKADIAIGYISIDKNRFTVVNPTAVLDMEEHAIVSARPKKSPRWQAVLEAFDLQTWFLLLLSLIVTGFLLYTSLHLNTQHRRLTLMECLFKPFKILLVEPVCIETPSVSTIIVLTFWLQMTFILVTFYTGSLTSLVTSPPYTEKPVESAEDLLKTGKIWLSLVGNANYEALDPYRDRGLKKIDFWDQSIDNRLYLVLEDNKYSFLIPKNIGLLQSLELIFENDENPMYVGKDTIMFLMNTWIVNKNCPFAEDLTMAILKIGETGLYEKYKSIYNFHQRNEGEKFKKYAIKGKKISISLVHFQKIVIVFLFGYLVAFVVFVTEIFIRNVKVNKGG